MPSSFDDHSQNDLQNLIREADQQLVYSKRRSPAKKKNFRVLAPILLILLLGYLLIQFFTPVPRKQVAADLIDILRDARTCIDTAWHEQGALPNNIPSPELASLVEYSPNKETETYSLHIQNGSIGYEWTSNNPDIFKKVEPHE
jgi:hypothetical protein